MDTKELEQASIDALSTKLMEQLKTTFDKRDTDLCEKLGKAIDEKVGAVRAEFDARHRKFDVPGFEKSDAQKFSFAKLIRGMITRDFSECGFEVEACKEAAKKKDMAAGTDVAGGFIVPNLVLSDQMIPLLKEQAIATALGATMWTGLRNSPVQIPKKTGATTAYWVGEAPGSGVTTSDLTFGQIELTPHTVAVRTRVSNRLILMSNPAVEQLIRQDMTEQLALEVDNAFFNGSGASNQPTGILQTSGINNVSGFGAASDWTAWDKLHDMLYELRKDHVKGDLAWAMHPAVLREFQQMIDRNETSTTSATGANPKSRRLFDSAPISDRLMGYRFLTSTQIPTNDLLLGLFSDAGIGVWDTMSIRVSDVAGTAFENLQTQILAAMDVDVAVRRTDSFCNTAGMTGATA